MRYDSPFADRITAAVFFALGASMAWGGFIMDRLEIRQIHPASIPGLVPMILGVALMGCAVLLALGAEKAQRDSEDFADGSWRNLGFTAIWSFVFAVGLVSRIPFVVATAIYIAGFSGWFLIPAAPDTRGRVRALLFVVIFGAVTATAISALFRYGFLVRLP